MATTPLQALPYPSLSDPPNGPAQLQALAVAVEKQLVMRFATTAARDAAIPAPVEGMCAYIGSGDVAEGPYYYHGSAWRLPWNMPWGVQALSSTVVSQSGIGATLTILSNLAASFTAVANRQYRITYAITVRQRTAAGVFTTQIYETGLGAGSPLAGDIQRIPVVDDYVSVKSSCFHVPGAGAKTYRGQASTSGGTLDTAPFPNNFIAVEDVGPTGAPS